MWCSVHALLLICISSFTQGHDDVTTLLRLDENDGEFLTRGQLEVHSRSTAINLPLHMRNYTGRSFKATYGSCDPFSCDSWALDEKWKQGLKSDYHGSSIGLLLFRKMSLTIRLPSRYEKMTLTIGSSRFDILANPMISTPIQVEGQYMYINHPRSETVTLLFLNAGPNILVWLKDWPREVLEIPTQFNTYVAIYINGISVGMDYWETSSANATVVSLPVKDAGDAVCIMLTYELERAVSGGAGLRVELKVKESTAFSKELTPTPGIIYHQRILIKLPAQYLQYADRRIEIISNRRDVYYYGSNTSPLRLYRISGCNPYGDEEMVIVDQSLESVNTTAISREPNELLSQAHLLRGFIPWNSVMESSYAPLPLANNGSNSKCRNGGTMDNMGNCICLPGFTGEFCHQGCGRNRYGRDCTGQCSGTRRECRGMYLCHPGQQCVCPPGFTGPLCNEDCVPGQYGNGCFLRCGKCRFQKPCNRYTGACPSQCDNGYMPPLCQEHIVHLRNPPIVKVTGFHTVHVSADMNKTSGIGQAKFFRGELKETDGLFWRTAAAGRISQSTNSSDTIEYDVYGLREGTSYDMRIILVDSFNRFHQNGCPPTTIVTDCIVPPYESITNMTGYYESEVREGREFDALQENYAADDVQYSQLKISWIYDEGLNWCPVKKFHVEVTWGSGEIASVNVSASDSREAVFSSHFFKDSTNAALVRIYGLTAIGKIPLSSHLHIHPEFQETIQNWTVVNVTSRSIEVWFDFQVSSRVILQLAPISTLSCQQLITKLATDFISAGGGSSKVIFDGLLPGSLYTLIANADTPYKKEEHVQTLFTTPHMAPWPLRPSVVNVTNSSAVLQWSAVEQDDSTCDGLNGVFLGYRYTLESAHDNGKVLEGEVVMNTISFSHLQPITNYTLKVHVVNSEGYNATSFLEIRFATVPTVPSPVRNLTVYRRSNRSLWLRWDPPLHTYGSLRAYSLHAVGETSQRREVVHNITQAECPAWPGRLCARVDQLEPNTVYNVTVRAQNSVDYPEGDGSSLTAITQEGNSDAPLNLRVVNCTSTSISIRWQLPDILSGDLRHFSIGAEEISSVKSNEDVENFTFRETQERRFYEYELRGLRPNATYLVTVSVGQRGARSMIEASTDALHFNAETPILEATSSTPNAEFADLEQQLQSREKQTSDELGAWETDWNVSPFGKDFIP